MALTAEQHLKLADGYEKAAGDLFVPSEQRVEFARRANSFRLLAKLQAKNEALSLVSTLARGQTAADRFRAVILKDNKPGAPRNGRAGITRLLTSLWLIGGVLYLISTLLLTNDVHLFGDDARSVNKDRSPASNPYSSVAQVDEIKSAPLDSVQLSGADPTVTDRPHVKPPEDTTSEAALGARSPVQQPLPAPVESTHAEMVRVVSAVDVRSGPSASAEVIGTVRAGAELQVKSRESDWVQFVNPTTDETGWISSAFLAPLGESNGTASAAVSAEELPKVEPPRRKPLKPKIVQHKPKASTKVSRREVPRQAAPAVKQHSNKRLSGQYVELLSDEEFLPPRKRGRFGIRGRRHQEGLMSPGLRPPQ